MSLLMDILAVGCAWLGLGVLVMSIVDSRSSYVLGRMVMRVTGVTPTEAILLMAMTWPAGLIWACLHERK